MTPTPAAHISHTHLKRPGEQAIAFAISVVLSKPDKLSVKEYIRLLTQHIAKGRRDAALSSEHQHLDRSSYWRSECERAKINLQAAEGETTDLRREIEQLKAKLDTAKSAAAAVAPTRKRKKVDEDVILVPRSPKRVRRDVSPVTSSRETEKDFDFSGVGEVGNVFMRALFQTHSALKSRNRVEAHVLAYRLISVAKALPPVVRQLMEGSIHGTAVDVAHVKTTLTAASRAVLSLIVGVNRLSHAAGGTDVQGSVIYAYVQMFSNLLDTMDEVSTLEIHSETNVSTIKSLTMRKKQAKAKQPTSTNLKGNAILGALTAFLCSILDLLNANSEGHKALFEGFAYCVFTKLGARLYTTTFGQARGATIEDEISTFNLTNETESEPAEQDIQVRQAIIEAPYLIHLLNRVMSTAPTHLGAVISAKTGRAKQANNKGSMKGALALAAKDRLQRTLVNCIFGTEGLEEGDSLLGDSLKAPAPLGPDLPVPKIKEADVQEWFQEEVWRLCGWEILEKEAGWSKE